MNEDVKDAKAARTVNIEIDGKQYPVAWDFNAMAAAEIPAGVNLLRALEDLSNTNAGQLAGLFYAGIKGGNPASKLKFKEVTQLIRIDTIPTITQGLLDSYALSIPGKVPADQAE